MGEADRAEALKLLRLAHGKSAEFHIGQWEAIEAVLQPGARMLVVQRTGWGKSVVYFIAARLLRDMGRGPTLLISPLLALMRNQVEMAARYGVRAATINSSNRDQWSGVSSRVQRGEIDCLLISPERLGDDDFRENVLRPLEKSLGMLVIDEAHCISDWGHDFRPDYRRIMLTVQRMDVSVPILCTTATANDRVINDLQEQFGNSLQISRGRLMRESLRIRVLKLPDLAKRLALLCRLIPNLPRCGIVYTLTVADAKRVAAWLVHRGFAAAAYYGELPVAERLKLEEDFKQNRLKCMVATTALGMGYDKSDVGFVVHFQRPGSIISYYQQIGRAGRAIDAEVVLIEGAEDDDINEYFIESAFPPKDCFMEIVRRLRGAPMRGSEMRMWMNFRAGVIDKALALLEVYGVIEPQGAKWALTGKAWDYASLRATEIGEHRRAEVAQMWDFAASDGCRMLYLAKALDDRSTNEPCGKCDRCTVIEKPMISRLDEQEAIEFIAKDTIILRLPKFLPPGIKDVGRKKIPADHSPRDGVALTMYGDSGWGALVKEGKYSGVRFDDALIQPSVDAIRNTGFSPDWVTWVPSKRHAHLVPDFARRLAAALGAEAVEAVQKVRKNSEQKTMQNSTTQFRNVWDAFEVTEVRKGKCLLIDDIVDSGWTLTVIALKLRQAGSGEVAPFALASSRPRHD
jgi:ATP-dependent DNA helicase RecQ